MSNSQRLVAGLVLAAFAAPALAQGQPVRETAPPPRSAELYDAHIIPLEQLGSFVGSRRWQNPDLFSVHEQRIIAALNALAPRPSAVVVWEDGFVLRGFGGSAFVHPFGPRPSGMSGGAGGGAPQLNPPSGTMFRGGFGGGGRGSGGRLPR